MVRLLSCLSALAACAVGANACVTIQHSFPAGTNSNNTRAAAVKEEYRYVWAQYKQQAFGKDELDPISMKGVDDIFGWGATIVDGIDTAIVMNLTDIVNEQLKWIAGVDFSVAGNSSQLIDEFDAVIRYIGGLISAYDLINSDLVSDGTYNKTLVDALLKAAVTISDGLKPAFDTPSGLPLANVNFTSGEATNCNPATPCDSTIVDTAQAGTIILEFFRLSDLTNDTSYHDLAAKAEANLISPNQTLLYPGLVGISLDYNNGSFLDFEVGWQGGIDSFYEYLIKAYVYNPTRADTQSYKDFWITAVNSTMKYLAKHPYNHPELTFITQADENGTLEYTMDDYACFAGGNLLLGGVYLDNPDYTDFGYAVTDSCHATFNTSAAGLNPFEWSWFNGTNQTYDASAQNNTADVAYAKRTGFFVDDPFWGAFPEPIESMFYAYRIGGDSVWQDYAWTAFEAMLKDTRNRTAGVTFAQLNNVTQPLGGTLNDNIPSFFFAEVLKYFYLIFEEPGVVSLDEWVFNTECHPFKIQTGTCATSY